MVFRSISSVFSFNFQSVFTNESSVSHDLLPPFSPFPNSSDILISEAGALEQLQELKVFKAAGPDQISPRILKELSHTIASIVILIMYRRSYETAQVPDDWKRLIWPQFLRKGKSLLRLEKNKPISLTCLACKIVTGSIFFQ